MIHYPVWAIVLLAFQVLHTIYTPKMVEKYENNEFKFGFCFKRRVVALNVGLLVSLFVCYLLVYGNMGIWEYGNVRIWEYGFDYIYRNMGIWEYGFDYICRNMGIWEYGNMGIWF